MYKTPVFVITFVLLCDIRVIISKPLAQEQQTLYLVRNHKNPNVEALAVNSKPSILHDKEEILGKVLINQNISDHNSIVIEPGVAKEAVNGLLPNQLENSDTKKQYYLIKVSEYYDFLPLYERENDAYLRLEIVDGDDMGYSTNPNVNTKEDVVQHEGLVKRNTAELPNKKDDSAIKVLKKREVSEENVQDFNSKVPFKKREISDETLKSTLNVFQTHFLKKRDIHDFMNDKNDEFANVLIKRDLGNFMSDADQSLTADLDDPQNNNYKFLAYVPFFRVRKYYLNRMRLDVN